MHKKLLSASGMAIIAMALLACNNQPSGEAGTADSAVTLTTVTMDSSAAPVALFDGKTLAGWHAYNKPGEIRNWVVQDGALVCLGKAHGDTGGDIVTDKEYENFELSFEWKISKGGNSGVMYHVIEDPRYKGPYETGPEYQVIDDIGFPQKLEEWQKAGADYAMNLADTTKKKLMPVGEWNNSRIVFNKGHVEHWLNGEKIVEFQAWTPEWEKEKKEGKWKDYPDYGSAKKGKIALQDHGDQASYRNIMIREL